MTSTQRRPIFLPLIFAYSSLPTPPLGQDMTQGQFLSEVYRFSFYTTNCLTKVEEPSLPYYLTIAGGRIIGFIPFPRVLVLCEMQLAWSRIWTRVAVSISYDNNHYTTYFRLLNWSFISQVYGLIAERTFKEIRWCRFTEIGQVWEVLRLWFFKLCLWTTDIRQRQQQELYRCCKCVLKIFIIWLSKVLHVCVYIY